MVEDFTDGLRELPVIGQVFGREGWVEVVDSASCKNPKHVILSGAAGGRGVEGSPEERELSFARSALPSLGGFFDSLADSLAQNDRYRLRESFLE